jgi:methionyl-tRNA formyltransferase
MKNKIVFFGSGDFTVPVVEKLLPHGLDLVVTNDKNPNSLLTSFCKQNNIPIIIASTTSELSSFNSQISNHSVAILASFGAIIPQSIIDGLPNGILNIHPSLLPKYKGPSPVQYALLNGETITGITIIKLDDKVDHGPILAQKPYQLTGNETSEDLLSILFEIGADIIEEIVIKFENGKTVSQTPQDHSKESWSKKISKQDGMIDLYKLQTINYKLENMVRAFYPWPGVWFISRIKNQELRIKLLPEGRIQVEGKNPMNYKDFINGFGEEGKLLLEKLGLN